MLGDAQQLTTLFDSAGVLSPRVSTRCGTARFPSIRSMVEADLRGWLPVMGVELSEERIREILPAAESVLRPYVAEDGQVVFDSPAHIVSATKP